MAPCTTEYIVSFRQRLTRIRLPNVSLDRGVHKIPATTILVAQMRVAQAIPRQMAYRKFRFGEKTRKKRIKIESLANKSANAVFNISTKSFSKKLAW